MPTPLPLFDTMKYHSSNTQSNYPYPNDLTQAINFIYSYRGSHTSFNAYRREIGRLLQWSIHVMQKPINQLNRQNIENYISYNPISQIRQKSKFIRTSQKTKVIRRLSDLQWTYCLETAEQLAKQDVQHERTLFILNALFGMYLRISELTASQRWQPTMNDFFQDNDGHWWFKTVGKGNKERHIVVSDAMVAALKRYRTSLNLPPLPDPHDTLPLVCKQHGKGPITSTRHIRAIVQVCFDKSYEQMQADGLEEDATTLKAATVHWLRHTGISSDVKIRPREHVRDDAGHSSSAITDHYIDVELRERHASGKNKVIKPETYD